MDETAGRDVLRVNAILRLLVDNKVEIYLCQLEKRESYRTKTRVNVVQLRYCESNHQQSHLYQNQQFFSLYSCQKFNLRNSSEIIKSFLQFQPMIKIRPATLNITYTYNFWACLNDDCVISFNFSDNPVQPIMPLFNFNFIFRSCKSIKNITSSSSHDCIYKGLSLQHLRYPNSLTYFSVVAVNCNCTKLIERTTKIIVRFDQKYTENKQQQRK